MLPQAFLRMLTSLQVSSVTSSDANHTTFLIAQGVILITFPRVAEWSTKTSVTPRPGPGQGVDEGATGGEIERHEFGHASSVGDRTSGDSRSEWSNGCTG